MSLLLSRLSQLLVWTRLRRRPIKRKLFLFASRRVHQKKYPTSPQALGAAGVTFTLNFITRKLKPRRLLKVFPFSLAQPLLSLPKRRKYNRPKLRIRIKKLLPQPLQSPSFLSWKRPIRPKIKRGKRLTRAPRKYVTPPTPSNLSWKRPLRPKIKRGKRFVRPRKYPILQPALEWVKLRRLKIKRGKRLTRAARLLPQPIVQPSNLSWKKPLRPKIKRGKRLTRARRTYPTVVFAAVVWKTLRRLQIKRKLRVVRQRVRYPYFTVAATPQVFNKPRPKVRIKRTSFSLSWLSGAGLTTPQIIPPALSAPRARRLKLHSRPTARFFHPRVKSKYPFQFQLQGFTGNVNKYFKGRTLRFVRRKLYPTSTPPAPAPQLAAAGTTYVFNFITRKLRLKNFGRFRYSIAGPPTRFIAFKKPPRPKIKRVNRNVRRTTKNYYVIPGVTPVGHAIEWLIRARRKGIR